jgi:hypothetical protein
MRRRVMACPMRLIPRGVAIQGNPHREHPGPDRERTRDPHGPHDPRMPPPLRRRAVGGAPALARAALAEACGAWAFCDRRIARPQHRPLGHDVREPTRQLHAGQFPCGPAARRPPPMRRGDMALCVIAHGPYDRGHGLATGRQHRPEPSHEAPVRRWGRASRLNDAPYCYRNSWDVQALDLSWCADSLVTDRRRLLHHDKPPFSTSKRVKVELRGSRGIRRHWCRRYRYQRLRPGIPGVALLGTGGAYCQHSRWDRHWACRHYDCESPGTLGPFSSPATSAET